MDTLIQLAAIALFFTHVMVAIDAYRTSTARGLLALFVPFVGLFHLFSGSKTVSDAVALIYIAAFATTDLGEMAETDSFAAQAAVGRAP